MKWTKIIFGAAGFVVVSQIVNLLLAAVTMNYYSDPNYFAVWSKVMMPAAGPPPEAFFAYSLIFSLITGTILSYFYVRTHRLISGTATQKGAKYGFALFLIAGLPFFLTDYLLVNLPFGLLLGWLLGDGLIGYVLGGIAIARLNG